MKRIIFLFTIITTITFIISCAATHPDDADTEPPRKPRMIPHLGVVGDVYFNEESKEWEPVRTPRGELLNDFNNGIDSVSGEDSIRLQWERVIDNVGVSRIEVFRYANLPHLQTPELISPPEGLPSNAIDFIDRLFHTDVGVVWHYYIIAYDFTGNSAESIPVNFMLMDRPIPVSPEMGIRLTNTQLRETSFIWSYEGSPVSKRFLFFRYVNNRLGDLEWSYDTSSIHEPMLMYTGEKNLDSGWYLWRVDVKGWVPDEDGIIRSGAKSEMMTFQII
jgi:hypothetical protein